MAEDAVPQNLNYRHSCRVGLRRGGVFAFYDGEGAVELFGEDGAAHSTERYSLPRSSRRMRTLFGRIFLSISS